MRSCRRRPSRTSCAGRPSSIAVSASVRVRIDVAAVPGEAEHPVRDGVDERLQPPLALAIEPDQQGDRDGRRRQVPGRQQDRLDPFGQLGDPADQVDDQAGKEDDAGHEDGRQLPARARRCDQPATDDHDRRHRRERQTAVQAGALVGDDREARRVEDVEGGGPDRQDRDGDPIDARLQLAARIGEDEGEQDDRGRVLERQRDLADDAGSRTGRGSR